MPEGGVSEIVRKADGFGKRFVERERPRDGAANLRNLERMGDPGAIQIALVIHEHLGLVDEAAERIRMDDAVASALEFTSKAWRRLWMSSAAALFINGSVRREPRGHASPATCAQSLAQRGIFVIAGDDGL